MKNKKSVILCAIYISTVCLLAQSPLHAQGKQAVQATTVLIKESSSNASRNIIPGAASAAKNSVGGVIALENQVSPTVKQNIRATIIKSVVQAMSPAKKSILEQNLAGQTAKAQQQNFSEKKKKILYSIMVSLGVEKRDALSTLYDMGAVPTHRPLPRLSGEKYILNDLAPYSVPPVVENIPPFPFPERKTAMYRGMALSNDGKGLQNILQNGMLRKDVKATNNQLLHSYMGPNARSVAKSSAVICFTDNPQSAADWAKTRSNEELNILVVAHAKNIFRGQTVMHGDDVLPSQITHLSALLQINAEPTWGKMTLLPDGQFSFEPYKK